MPAIEFDKVTRCIPCKGTGKINKRTHVLCNGTGFLERVESMYEVAKRVFADMI